MSTLPKAYQSRPSVTGPNLTFICRTENGCFFTFLALELGGVYGIGAGVLTGGAGCLQVFLRRFGDGYCVL